MSAHVSHAFSIAHCTYPKDRTDLATSALGKLSQCWAIYLYSVKYLYVVVLGLCVSSQFVAYDTSHRSASDISLRKRKRTKNIIKTYTK